MSDRGPPVRAERGVPPWGAALVALAAILVFANSLPNGFAYDDIHIIVDNSRVHSLETIGAAVTRPYWPIEEGEQLGLWRPVAMAYYTVVWWIGDGSPFPFHMGNVLLHALVSVLVAMLVGRVVGRGPGVIGGLIFAVHPLHSEVVANVVGFAELFGALTMVAACLVYQRWRRDRRIGQVAAVTVLFGLGFLTKESVITLVGVLFLLDMVEDDLPVGRWWPYLRSRLPVLVPIAAMAGLVMLGRRLVLGRLVNPLPPLGADLLTEIPRIWTLGEIWLHYVRLLFFPVDLSADYSPGVISIHLGWGLANTTGAVLGLALLALAFLTWRAPGRAGARAAVTADAGAGPDPAPSRVDPSAPRPIAVGILWFVITIAPVSNFFFLSGVLLGERTLYTPSIGLSIGAGWAAWELLRRHRDVTAGALLIILGLLSARTVTRNPTWADTETVFITLIQDHLEAGRAQWVLGDTYWSQNRVPEALRSYRAAVGTIGSGYSLIGAITKKLLGIEAWRPAETLARRLWAEHPELDAGPALVAVALMGQDRFEEAVEVGHVAAELDPDDAVTRHMLSSSYQELGRYPEAIEQRRAAIALGEGDHWQQWYWLAQLQVLAGDTASALSAADSARARARPTELPLVAVDSLVHALARTAGDR